MVTAAMYRSNEQAQQGLSRRERASPLTRKDVGEGAFVDARWGLY